MLHLHLMRIIAVIPVYNPDLELLTRDIDAFAPRVEAVLLWQNSPLDRSAFEGRPWQQKLRFCGDGTNAGIARALNFAWKTAAEEAFDAVLTMDQDSVWEGFSAFMDKVSAPDAPEGYYGPGVNDKAFEGDFRRADNIITSGMLVPLEIINSVGGWDEDFAVDGVDNDFIFHALSLGIKGWLTGDCILHQQFGKVEFRHFLGFRYRVYNYSPERLYGIYRNNLMVIRRYPCTKDFALRFRRNWFWRKPVRILLGESDKKAKFTAIRRGIRDSRREAHA